uniref:Uncharacterized protein n=1 Tax=Meloidogyne floridensis TaxID=298350 RepID=A0A915NLQ6_9BILA
SREDYEMVLTKCGVLRNKKNVVNFAYHKATSDYQKLLAIREANQSTSRPNVKKPKVEIPKVGDILTTLPDTRMCPLCVGTKVDYDFAKHCNIHHPDFIKQNVVFAHTGEVNYFVYSILKSVGLSQLSSAFMADAIDCSDKFGCKRFGLESLMSTVIKIASEDMDELGDPKMEQQGIQIAVDGSKYLGPVVGRYCMDKAVEFAERYGVGIGIVFSENSLYFSTNELADAFHLPKGSIEEIRGILSMFDLNNEELFDEKTNVIIGVKRDYVVYQQLQKLQHIELEHEKRRNQHGAVYFKEIYEDMKKLADCCKIPVFEGRVRL